MIQQGQCTIFKQNCYSGLENFASGTPYTYKIALYTAYADLGPSTLAYTTVNEISGTGYTAGGEDLQNPVLSTDGTTAYVTFDDITWNPASFTARGALVYNYTTKAACFILNFGSDKTSSSSFTVQFPAATSTSAILTMGSYTSATVVSSGD